MLEWQDEGIILSLRPHGETGGVLSLLTKQHGRTAGYVYGASSAKSRGTLEAGNLVFARWQAKSSDQLGSFSLELEKSYAAAVMDDPVKLTALQSALALADKTLFEREKHPGVYEGLKALLESFSADLWAPTYIFWEIGLLRELGFGLDFSACAATGTTENLIYMSPKSGRAVSALGGAGYEDRLLHLPSFLRGGSVEEKDILEGLQLTGHFLLHRVFSQMNSGLPEPRLRLEEHIKKTILP